MDASRLNRSGFHPRHWLPGLACLLLLGGCVSTSLIERWRDPTYNGPPLHRLLIVGAQRDDGRRRIWEDGMVTALARHGVQATASYVLFPSKAPNAEELAATAAREGFDGVLASLFVSASLRNYWIPGYAGLGYGWRWRYYGYWDAVYGPGYVETEQRADYQTDVFTVDSAGGRLIWTGITRSVDLSSTHSITIDISRVLVPTLTKQGILAGKS
jgi:hypothetical protein